ncbi:hypothetical protein NDU88_007763 [Pleurodeles waltl]|uniref:Uncharacterized protein n=1 Tax=Pleurodeles waltl TaxID=8319 RepID=A0AAV7P1Q5_PLEWA|nr:hypothetical protein NDU88_007763 [Pleurodeles waltl]
MSQGGLQSISVVRVKRELLIENERTAVKTTPVSGTGGSAESDRSGAPERHEVSQRSLQGVPVVQAKCEPLPGG